jgi:DNA-binding CsgD family transcriptional regulator
MTKDQMTLQGRTAELSELDTMRARMTTDRHTLAVVRGAPGIGKTALLTVAENRWRRDAVTVITVRFAGSVAPWDLFGVSATVRALRERFEELGDLGLADPVNALDRLCTPQTYDSARGRSGLLVALARIFGRIRRAGPVVLIADDLDTVGNPLLAVAPACLPGYLVVAACRDDGHFADAPVQLAQLADRLIELGPLPADCVGPLLARRIGTAVDDSLLTALQHALGPLAHDPGTLLSTIDCLRREGRIAVVHAHACLSGGDAIALPAEHDLVRHVRRLGAPGRELIIMAATSRSFGIDDLPSLAAATGHDLAGYGRAVDTLVTVGALVSSEAGQLSCTCPALASSVLADAPDAAAQLHGALAGHLLATGGASADIADHAAAAERELPPSKELARLLVAEADRAVTSEPDRAARSYHTALRHGDEDALRALTRLLIREGHYAWLRDVNDEFPVSTGNSDTEPAAAVLTALRTCTPVPAEVRAALDIGIPRSGPLAHYHQVVTGYATGDWETALSAARELELTRAPERPATPAHQFGGLLAAEICTAQGNLRQAASWLDSVGEDPRYTAMRGWVEAGVQAADGETAQALATGWWAYRRIPADNGKPGKERLLARLAVIAMGSGHPDWGATVLTEMADLHGRENTRYTREAVLFVSGVVTRDEASVRASADKARDRGHLPDLLAACLALGELAGQPQPWLHEAHDIARQLGSGPLRARARTLMKRRGVSVPRAGDGRSSLSDTEMRIVEEIRRGRTNRQIGLALLLTEKTVEYYLSRLFVKTGCRSRVDLAAASVRGNLVALGA